MSAIELNSLFTRFSVRFRIVACPKGPYLRLVRYALAAGCTCTTDRLLPLSGNTQDKGQRELLDRGCLVWLFRLGIRKARPCAEHLRFTGNPS
jgi:hypothetical protein